MTTTVLRQAALSVAAYRRIAPFIIETPCIASKISFQDDTELFFKAENFQKTGSFKFRGALSKLTSLDINTPIITASSGNHGIALSTAAALTGHKLSVVLPTTVTQEKLEKIKSLGVETILYSNDAGLAEKHAQTLAKKQGEIYVSPYNDELVIAGQGTIALELLQQMPRLDVVFVSIGGGGLISGIGAVLKAFSPKTRVVGVSAKNSAALAASIRAGKVVEIAHSDTLADGCAGGIDTDAITVSLASEVVDELIEFSEEKIAEAITAIAWEEKMLVEGAAGLALCPWRAARNKYASLSCAVVLCGANFDRDKISPIISMMP